MFKWFKDILESPPPMMMATSDPVNDEQNGDGAGAGAEAEAGDVNIEDVVNDSQPLQDKLLFNPFNFKRDSKTNEKDDKQEKESLNGEKDKIGFQTFWSIFKTQAKGLSHYKAMKAAKQMYAGSTCAQKESMRLLALMQDEIKKVVTLAKQNKKKPIKKRKSTPAPKARTPRKRIAEPESDLSVKRYGMKAICRTPARRKGLVVGTLKWNKLLDGKEVRI